MAEATAQGYRQCCSYRQPWLPLAKIQAAKLQGVAKATLGLTTGSQAYRGQLRLQAAALQAAKAIVSQGNRQWLRLQAANLQSVILQQAKL